MLETGILLSIVAGAGSLVYFVLNAWQSDARRTRLQEIRTLIAATLDLPDDLTYPVRREGRA